MQMIYLIRSHGLGKSSILKIGFTENYDKRMDQYFYNNPLFEVISVREGDEILEKLFHCYLRFLGLKFHKNGKLKEWFIDSPIVLDVFHISRDTLERKLWKQRNKIFKLTCSGDSRIYYYLFNKFNGDVDINSLNNRIDSYRLSDLSLKKFIESLKIQVSSREYEKIISIIEEFKDDFFVNNNFSDRLRLYCHYRDLYENDHFVIDSLNILIEDSDFQKFYEFYGTKGCKAKKYRRLDLENGFKDEVKNDPETIKSLFVVGEKYTKKDIKSKLILLYNQLGILKSPKATDIESYFEVKSVLISNPSTGKRDKGYLIIKEL